MTDEQEPKEAVPWVEPTREQLQAAESTLRHAQVYRMRGDVGTARRMTLEAYQTAPTCVDVLLAYADDLVDQGKSPMALELVGAAHRARPEDVALDKKFAELVLRVRFRVTDFESLDDVGGYASGKSALLLSVFIPGLGHMALEEYVRGGIFMGVWFVSIAALFLVPHGVEGIASIFAAKPKEFNPVSLLPVIVGVVDYAWSIGEISQIAKRRTPLQIEKPVPPDNRPF